MNKTHICYLVSSLCNEGPVNVMYNIIRYIDFDKFKVSIITFIPEKQNSRLEEFKQFPINIYQLGKNSKLAPWNLFFALKNKIKEINPDILHTHCPRSMFLAPLLPKRYKKVETVHIYPGIQQKVMYGKVKGETVIALSHFFTKRMDLPIACSESVAQSYKDEQGYEMLAIPNGCSLPLWERDEKRKCELRKMIGLKNDMKYFIFIGRFSKEKNPDLIVKTFEMLDNAQIGVILLGNGEMYDELKSHESERVILPGFKSNVYDYLIAADYYISASDVEGLANTLLESMTVGLPCVLSNIPSHQEVLRKAESTIGYTFDNKDVQSLLDAVHKTMQLNYTSTSCYIQKLFTEHYTAKGMSKKYQSEYIKLLDK